jgi:hypothetical protein
MTRALATPNRGTDSAHGLGTATASRSQKSKIKRQKCAGGVEAVIWLTTSLPAPHPLPAQASRPCQGSVTTARSPHPPAVPLRAADESPKDAHQPGWPDHLVVGSRSDRKPRLPQPTTKTTPLSREVPPGDQGASNTSIPRVALRRCSTLALLLLTGLLLGCEAASPPPAVLPPAPTAEELAALTADLDQLNPQKPATPPAEPAPSSTAPADPAATDPAPTAPPSTPAEPPAPKSEPAVPEPAAPEKPEKVVTASATIPATRTRPSLIPAGPSANPLPGGVRILIPSKTFKPEGAERALRVSFDDLDLLKVLNMEPITPDAVERMPDWLKGLDGQTIRLRGFMYPPSFPDGITRFLLARDNQICCFGRNPKAYDIVAVTLREDAPTHYIENRPFDVIGTFHIEQQTFDDIESGTLYRLDNAQVLER